MMRLKGFLIISVVLFSACSFFFLDEKGKTHEENENVVTMTNSLVFEPKKIEIKAGETVKWKNTSDLVHTVTCDPEEATMKESVILPEGAKAFNSGNMEAGDTYEYTFEKRGTYRYFCIPHEGTKMRGEVIVK